MALAASLIPGFQYRVQSGPLTNEVVTIVDNKAFPDGHVQQRKITIEFDGQVTYILPRLLDDTPVAIKGRDIPTVSEETVDAEPQIEIPHFPAAPITNMQQLVESHKALPLNDPMDPRLDFLRPMRSKAARYIQRTMKNGMTDIEMFLQYASSARRAENDEYPVPFALKGDTQSGKTFAVIALAVFWSDYMAEQQRAAGIEVTYTKPMPIFTLSGSAGVTDFQMFGQPAVDQAMGDNHIVWLMGIVDMAAMCGGILYVDEINALLERTTTALFSLLDHRHEFTNYNKPKHIGGDLYLPTTIRAHPDFWPIATYNEGYEGMAKLNKAVHQRFDHILWDYSEEVEKKLISSATVLEIGKAFRTARKNRKLKTPVGTAVLERIERNIQSFGVDVTEEIFLGMFTAEERGTAEAILKDRSLIASLHEEERARRMNKGQPVPASTVPLANVLDEEAF